MFGSPTYGCCSISFKTGRSPPQLERETGDSELEEDEPSEDDGASAHESEQDDPSFKPDKPKSKARKRSSKADPPSEHEGEGEDVGSGDVKVSGTFASSSTPRLSACFQSLCETPSEAGSLAASLPSSIHTASICESFESYMHDDVVSSEEGEQHPTFADLLRTIAEFADVKAEPKQIFKAAQFVHLESEDYTPPPESLALTTTRSIPAFLTAWWREFATKDMGGTDARALKWGHLYRQRESRPSLRPYIPADEVVACEPLADPPNCYKWLVQPSQRMDVTMTDAKNFEALARQTLSVANFMEASLQALRRCTQREMIARMMQAMSPALKSIIQLQAATVCQWIQARRDHWLARAANLSMKDLQTLRHAPIVGVRNLFPSTAMESVNSSAHKSMKYSALLSIANHGKQFARPAKPKNEQTNKYGTLFAIPDLARDPYVVRTGCSVVEPNVQVSKVEGSREEKLAQIVETPASEVGRSLIKPVRAYEDRDDTPLATNEQVSDWEMCYEEMAYRAARQCETPVGGRLTYYVDAWQSIGCSRKVLRWLAKGYRLPFVEGGQAQALACRRRVCPRQLRIHYTDPTKSAALHELIRTLLEKRVIEEIAINANVFHCLLFLRPKPNGKWRAITDVSPLNELLRVKKFKMDTPKVIREALTYGLWATSVDFSDAYHHIPIHPAHRQFLAFQVGQRKFWYRASPFGLAPLPQVFTEIFTAIKAFVRERYNVMIFQYLDDWLLLARDRQLLAEATLRFVRLCMDLGIVVNVEKSELVPTQRLVHLGIEWNFATCIVRPPMEKVTKLRHTIALVLKEKKARLPTLESLRGQLCALEKVVPYGRINFRFFQALVTRALKKGRNARWLHLTPEALEDLWWWVHEDNMRRGAPFRPPSPEVIVTSDASTHGWGASFEGQTLAGRWRDIHSNRHINWLEMEAVRLTIERQARVWKGKAVRFLIDNRTTVAYIMKQGGTSSAEMTALTRRLLQLTNRLDIHLDAHHLAGEKNVVADLLSRRGEVCKNEWKLDEATFLWIQRHSPFGPATVDLFANQLNHQLPRYGSPHHDVNALLVDSLNSLWPRNEVLYAFPPANILAKVLEKIREEREVFVLLIAPITPTTTWYPTLKRVAHRCEPLPRTYQLMQPHCDIVHPDSSSTRLAMWAILGRDF